jgi:hypothetical protein
MSDIQNREEKASDNDRGYGKILIGFIAIAVIFFTLGSFLDVAPTITGYMPSPDIKTPEEAGSMVVDHFNKYLLNPGFEATLVESKLDGDLYAVTMEITRGDDSLTHTAYVTKSGEILFPEGVDITETPSLPEINIDSQQPTPPAPSVPKTDVPEAHAFVMSYCPYGLQFLKAYVPVIELLGDKATIEVNFVDYAMHGKEEIDENTRMHCIQKEQADRFTDYLRCFLGSDDYEGCIQSAGVDSAMLDACIAAADEEFGITALYEDQSSWRSGRFPVYPVDGDMATAYGVQGSPTFVVNGQTVSVDRSAEAVKQAVCAAFNNPPAECDQTLSTSSEAPGIGPIGSSSGTASVGGCGA